MRYLLIILAILAVYIAFESARAVYYIRISSRLVTEAKAFTREEGTKSLLVLGDSTAVGVGSKPEDTVAGRLSHAADMSVENYAVSGAQTKNLAAQYVQTQKTKYDLVVIHIGANDIIRFHSPEDAATELDRVLKLVRGKSDHVVLLTAGKVGKAPFFPRGLGWIWTAQAKKTRTPFMEIAEKNGVAYIDLYSIPDPFNADPAKYYAPDGLHLTGDGYKFWFEAVTEEIEKRWPQLIRR